MPSSTKWRLYVTLTGGAYCNVMTLALYDATGADLCTGGTATASSEYSPPTTAADKAFDGNSSTYWEAAGTSAPWWLQYEFASAVTVTHYGVATGPFLGEAPLSFQLEYWTGAAWVAVGEGSSAGPAWQTGEVRTYPVESGYGWRLNVSANQSGLYVAASEIQFRGTAGGANLATAAGRADTKDGALAELAIDGNTATDWSSANTGTPQWWRYVFPSPTTIAEYTIRVSADYTTKTPKDWTLEYWDGTAWVVVDTQTGQTGWSAGETRTYTLVVAGSGALVGDGLTGGRFNLVEGGLVS